MSQHGALGVVERVDVHENNVYPVLLPSQFMGPYTN